MERHGNPARALVVLFLVAVPVAAVIWFVYRITERTITAIDRNFGDTFWLVLAVILAGAVVFVAVGGAVALVRRWNRHIRARDGLFPILETRHGIVNANEPGAQTLAALAGAAQRVSAPTAARVIDAHYRNVNAPQPAQDAPQIAQPALTARDVVSVDPREHPHWLLVGSTGSGKTVASYAVLSELARRAACQFVITEPGGVNWGNQTTATNTADIARAILDVQAQMIERQALLRQYDVDHVQDLPEPLPYLVLVAEETESVLDDLRLANRTTRDATIIALRSIARQGRKAGVCLVAVTQSSSVDVLDGPTRRNLSNVLLFRSQHTVGETWRVSRDVRLAELPTGAAWSVRHSSLVSFPYATRPALPAVATAQPIDAIAVDWPTTGAVATVAQSGRAVVQRLDAGREPDAQLAATMRTWYAGGMSKTQICLRVWSYKDGVVWSHLDAALAGEL